VVEYKKGRDNVAADSLSRREKIDLTSVPEQEDASLITLVAVESFWLNQIKKMVENDDFIKNLKVDWNSGVQTSIRSSRIVLLQGKSAN